MEVEGPAGAGVRKVRFDREKMHSAPAFSQRRQGALSRFGHLSLCEWQRSQARRLRMWVGVRGVGIVDGGGRCGEGEGVTRGA